jgi:tetratricopeptide (TPR) repeat protein
MWEILGHPDAAREAAQQALAGGTVWATLRAAELELAGDRYDAALQLLASDQPRDATADVAAAWIEARADAALGDVSDARRAYAATGELDGNAGAELVQLLVRSRQMDEAMGRALRLVALAGDSASAVDLGTLELLYPSLLDLADNPDRAKTILEAVRRLGAMNRFPALNLVKLEAYVLVRLGRDEEALSTVRRVRGLGIVDVAAVRLERGILSRLGRTGEATRIEAELRHIDPEALASDPLQGMR